MLVVVTDAYTVIPNQFYGKVVRSQYLREVLLELKRLWRGMFFLLPSRTHVVVYLVWGDWCGWKVDDDSFSAHCWQSSIRCATFVQKSGTVTPALAAIVCRFDVLSKLALSTVKNSSKSVRLFSRSLRSGLPIKV